MGSLGEEDGGDGQGGGTVHASFSILFPHLLRLQKEEEEEGSCKAAKTIANLSFDHFFKTGIHVARLVILFANKLMPSLWKSSCSSL